MYGFATRAIHQRPGKKDVHGSLRVPVYDNVAFEHDTAQSIQLAFEGKKPAHTYSRISNPTVEDFEQRIRELSGSLACLAVSSGMAAINATIMALAEAGSNIVTTKKIFGNTLSLFEKTFGPWGLETRCVSMTEPAEIEKAIDKQTRAIFLESITNPHLEVADFEAVGTLAKKYGIPLVLDNTVMTPYLFDSKKVGVNIEILSSTKSISGGATSVGGVILDHGNRSDVLRNTGSCLAPHNAYLQSLGLETLSLRLDKTCTNTQKIAEFLEAHSQVSSVHYPGLKSSPYYERAVKLFGNKCGGLLTFDLGSKQTCFALIDSLQLIRRATNINDNKTLIVHPASTIFAEYSEEEQAAMCLRPTMLRLSVGIENSEDLIQDLQKGLENR